MADKDTKTRDTKTRDMKTRILGKRTGRTILQLVVASIIVGALFSFIGLGPREFWRGVFETARKTLAMLGDSVGEVVATLGAYLLIGAAIVVPIWLIVRLVSGRK